MIYKIIICTKVATKHFSVLICDMMHLYITTPMLKLKENVHRDLLNSLSAQAIGKYAFIGVSVTEINESPKGCEAMYYPANPPCQHFPVKKNYHGKMSCLMNNRCWFSSWSCGNLKIQPASHSLSVGTLLTPYLIPWLNLSRSVKNFPVRAVPVWHFPPSSEM